jgi:hypothetical protein
MPFGNKRLSRHLSWKIVINNRKAFAYNQLRNLMNVEICLFSKDLDRDTNPTAFKRSAEKKS